MNISTQYKEIQNSSRNKILVILNEAHAISNPDWIDMWQKRVGQYLSEEYGNEKITSVLINSVTTDENDKDILIQKGYWDSAFKIAKNDNVGFDFSGSPFGKDRFDYANGKNNYLFTYQDIFTGFVFYKPIEQHKLSNGINGIVSDDYRNEFLRRIKIYNGVEYYEELKDDRSLKGWNKIEYYKYDNFNEMINEINVIVGKYKTHNKR